MAFGDLKDLIKRTASDKFLWDKAFKIVVNPKYHGHQRGLASMAYKYFDKKCAGNGIKNETTQFQQLVAELHKQIIRKLKKEKYIHHLKTIFGVLI